MASKKGKHSGMFLTLSVPYLLFIVLPIVVLGIVAVRSIEITKQQERQKVISATVQSRDRLDIYLKNIELIMPLIQNNRNLIALDDVTQGTDSSASFLQWKAISSMEDVRMVENKVNVGIYYPLSDGFLTPNHFINHVSGDKNNLFSFGTSSLTEFNKKNLVDSRDYRPLFFPNNQHLWNGKETEGMLYRMRLSSNSKADVYFLLSTAEIRQSVSALSSYGESMYLLDINQKVLYTQGNELDFEPEITFLEPSGFLEEGLVPKGYIGCYANSDYGLTVLAVLSMDEAFPQVKSLQKLVLYLVIAAVALTLVYVYFLINRNNRKVTLALTALNNTLAISDYHGGDVLDYLNQSVLTLINNNSLLMDDVSLQVEVLQTSYLEKLIQGSFQDEHQRKLMEERSHLDLTAGAYCVISFYLDEQEREPDIAGLVDFSAAKQEFFHKMQKKFKDKAFFYSNSNTQITAIFLLSEGIIPSYQATVSKELVPMLLAEEENFAYVVVGSPVFYQIDEVSEQHTFSHEMYLHSPLARSQRMIYWTEPLEVKKDTVFVFSPSLEKQLLVQIRAGAVLPAQETVKEIFGQSVNQRPLSQRARQIFFSQLKMTILKSLQPNLTESYQNIVLEISNNQSLEAVMEQFQQIVGSISTRFFEQGKGKEQELKRDMMKYVDENFRSPDISLVSVAEGFSMSDAYFSHLFKENIGENFSTYLERKRLEYAKKLLLETNQKVEDIALDCGYNSTNTFRRAYKRYYGMSPSDTRVLEDKE